MLHRLKEYIDYKGVSVSKFEKSIGMSNASFGKSLKTNGTIGADKLEIILNMYRDLNLYWLITGEGDMIKGAYVESSVDLLHEKPPNYRSQMAELKVIRAQEETIETLKRYIILLETQLKDATSKKEKPGEAGQKRKAG